MKIDYSIISIWTGSKYIFIIFYIESVPEMFAMGEKIFIWPFIRIFADFSLLKASVPNKYRLD